MPSAHRPSSLLRNVASRLFQRALPLGRALGRSLLSAVDRRVPKSRESIVIHTFPDADDQGIAMCLGLQAAGWNHPVVWLVNEDPTALPRLLKRRGIDELDLRFVSRRTPAAVWAFLRAGWIFYTHGLLGSYRPPSSKVVVNLWHGMPIKKIWSGVPGSKIVEATYLLSTSRFFSQVLTQASEAHGGQLIETGLPRNDLISRRRPEIDAAAKRLRGGARRLILFLPTYRRARIGFITEDGCETDDILGLTRAEEERLRAWLRNNACCLLVKPHPMSIHSATARRRDDDAIRVLDDASLRAEGIGLYELLGQIDLLITDVSSVCVDFLLTGRPQIIFFPDLEEYQRTRGFLLEPVRDYLPGPLVQSYDELERKLNDWCRGRDDFGVRRRELRELMHDGSGSSAAMAVLTQVGVLTVAQRPSAEAEPTPRLRVAR